MAVAILGILASIALPRYQAAQYKARTTEVFTILGTARQAQYAWFGQWDCFAALRRTPEAGFPPNFQSTPWVSTLTNQSNRCLAVDYSFLDADVGGSFSNVYHFYECETRPAPPDFTCSAVGDLDNDTSLAEYVYCTDHADTGVCVPSSAGTVSLFPFSVFPNNVGDY